ncbi:MOSC domain-containing protein [Puniceibacterium confluentis]|uniref:MOSC domain-containing protein n=1 Tax=Puniceibacterium confluentis TaxID=1958944 RepID=UPI003562CDA3
MRDLLRRHHAPGRIVWIGVRAARLADLRDVESCALSDSGLEGDHARPGKRALTLLQAEHLPVIAALAGLAEVTPQMLRRNIVVAGINLSALRGASVCLGAAVIEITGPCAPCSRMETTLGRGMYNAMRGHGGWCASVTVPGRIARGDSVVLND